MKIIYLEDSDDLRMLMAEIMTAKFGEKCLCLASLSELKNHMTEVLGSRLAILDINLGLNEPNGLDAYNWLLENKYQGKVFFLTGHASSHPLVAKAYESGVGVWVKPVSINLLSPIIKEILNTPENKS